MKEDGVQDSHTLHVCSFCGKGAEEVRQLIESPENQDGKTVFICDECVSACNEIIAEGVESPESLVQADLLPESPSTEQIIEEAWKAGLTPELVATDEVRKAQSQAARRAADARHASNRAAKQKALELFASNTYCTK